jgi:hypothetical protein
MGMPEIARADIAPSRVRVKLARLRELVPLVAGGAFSLATTDAHASARRRALACVLYTGDGVTVYLGGSRGTLQRIEKELAVPLEWLT